MISFDEQQKKCRGFCTGCNGPLKCAGQQGQLIKPGYFVAYELLRCTYCKRMHYKILSRIRVYKVKEI